MVKIFEHKIRSPVDGKIGRSKRTLGMRYTLHFHLFPVAPYTRSWPDHFSRNKSRSTRWMTGTLHKISGELGRLGTKGTVVLSVLVMETDREKLLVYFIPCTFTVKLHKNLSCFNDLLCVWVQRLDRVSTTNIFNQG